MNFAVSIFALLLLSLFNGDETFAQSYTTIHGKNAKSLYTILVEMAEFYSPGEFEPIRKTRRTKSGRLHTIEIGNKPILVKDFKSNARIKNLNGSEIDYLSCSAIYSDSMLTCAGNLAHETRLRKTTFLFQFFQVISG